MDFFSVIFFTSVAVLKCLMLAFQQTKYQGPQILDLGEHNSALHFPPQEQVFNRLSAELQFQTLNLSTHNSTPEVKPLTPLLVRDSVCYVRTAWIIITSTTMR